MDEIGEILMEARLSSGISIEEASKDTKIDVLSLESIEAGKIGAFKDILEVKEYIGLYAKYLGLDEEKIIDDFNEFLFEYTSKIPVKELEKTMELKQKEINKIKEKAISSPYTIVRNKKMTLYYVLAIALIILLVAITIAWCISQVLYGQVQFVSLMLGFGR